MKRFLIACLLGVAFILGGCFAPKVDLGDLDNLVRIDKKDDDKDEKKDKDKERKKKDDD